MGISQRRSYSGCASAELRFCFFPLSSRFPCCSSLGVRLCSELLGALDSAAALPRAACCFGLRAELLLLFSFFPVSPPFHISHTADATLFRFLLCHTVSMAKEQPSAATTAAQVQPQQPPIQSAPSPRTASAGGDDRQLSAAMAKMHLGAAAAPTTVAPGKDAGGTAAAETAAGGTQPTSAGSAPADAAHSDEELTAGADGGAGSGPGGGGGGPTDISMAVLPGRIRELDADHAELEMEIHNKLVGR